MTPDPNPAEVEAVSAAIAIRMGMGGGTTDNLAWVAIQALDAHRASQARVVGSVGELETAIAPWIRGWMDEAGHTEDVIAGLAHDIAVGLVDDEVVTILTPTTPSLATPPATEWAVTIITRHGDERQPIVTDEETARVIAAKYGGRLLKRIPASEWEEVLLAEGTAGGTE